MNCRDVLKCGNWCKGENLLRERNHDQTDPQREVEGSTVTRRSRQESEEMKVVDVGVEVKGGCRSPEDLDREVGFVREVDRDLSRGTTGRGWDTRWRGFLCGVDN